MNGLKSVWVDEKGKNADVYNVQKLRRKNKQKKQKQMRTQRATIQSDGRVNDSRYHELILLINCNNTLHKWLAAQQKQTKS